jgi:hypothetical protein
MAIRVERRAPRSLFACIPIAPPLRLRAGSATAFALVGALGSPPGEAAAQTSQRLSVQASGIYADLFGDEFGTLNAGVGLEVQLRYTPSALSIGGGLQYTVHGDSEAEADGHDADIDLLGVFVEPRYVISTRSERVAPYVSARLALARFDVRVEFSDGEVLTFTASGGTFNGGGGLLVRLTPRMNLDLGATAGYTSYEATEGSVAGQQFEVQLGSGTNLVLRLGVAVGLGS